MKVPFGLYIHVPFCSSRCGYCDFNTYTPGELGGTELIAGYLDALDRELELAAARVGRPAETVFVGGGTPSLLGAEGLARVLGTVKKTFGLVPGAEVTTESNPESTSPEYFAGLLEAGFTRLSLGMQSASPGVLAILERAHTPGRAFDAAREALAAGFQHVNLDMIYGTPTERDADVRETLERVLDTGVDHVSAYSLIVEDGTRMARKVNKGLLPAPDEDVLARRYNLIADTLEQAGYDWYEVSNWARPGGECQHNRIYWVDGNWWGAGPGAHSHLGEERFFNVKHPRRYVSQLLEEGQLPIQGKDTEVLTAPERHTEKIMLGLRLREGIPEDWLAPAAAGAITAYEKRGLLERSGGRLRVSAAGRLLADGIITDLLLAEEAG
ncbi:coproporphyrinogen III oxidase [Corynebacterium phocae]|uniref:Heme chaperone HemW n=1 Tax=Corynebacterium phocae TaxID=161895 RepID=A0A1L7D1Y9_9CORY|nr:radical SAM family heme chaperone HemW [Corynebacterium phocae]APT92110.1 coproporphyrinogen III oxidase [Corynebacterium phocae]KAA8726496.1 coproporphyrinogen III oxidase [Corynebacterium phocae]